MAVEVLILSVLVAVSVRNLDFQEIIGYARQIRLPVVLAILGFQFGVLVLGAAQWHLFVTQSKVRVGFFTVLRARVSGFAVSYITPSVLLGGEAARVVLLRDRSRSLADLFAAVTVDKYVELLTKILFVAVGFSLAMTRMTLHAFVVIGGAVLLLSIGLFLYGLVRVFNSETFLSGFVRMTLRPVARWRPRLVRRIVSGTRIFERSVRRTVSDRRVFYAAVGIGLAVGFTEVLEVYYILTLLGHYVFVDSFTIFSGALIVALLNLIPGNIGGMEAGHGFVFRLLSIGANKGVVCALLIRMGQLSFVGVGLINLLTSQFFRRRESLTDDHG